MPFYNEPKSQILMLGGRRAGKSSILASIVQNIKSLGRGDLFTIIGEEAVLESGDQDVSLNRKRREIQGFINNRGLRKNPNACVLVDMSPSKGRTKYMITTRIGYRSDAVFEFLDVPGEDMEEQVQVEKSVKVNEESAIEGADKIEVKNPNYQALMEKARVSDVVIVAIDTPFLMEAPEGINDVYNRIPEISKITTTMRPSDNKDKKLIILCPVKCEKWINEKRIDEVTKKTRYVYRDLINAHVMNPLFQIWIMPIATAGGLEHFKMMNGYRFIRKENKSFLGICNQRIAPELGSIDENTGQIYAKNGEILNRDQVEIKNDTEPDKSLLQDGFYIPLSWYKRTGEYKPSLCEQPAYHIIRFLAKKAKENARWYQRLGNLFSGHLDNYIEMVQRMENENLIKTEGDGFMQVMDLVVGPNEEQQIQNNYD